jgi:hypothetical protein
VFAWLRQLIERIAEWIRRCLPTYDPAALNDANGIQYNNNCYNYACDIKTGTFAQPGRGTGHVYASIDCADVGNGAVSDGLKPIDCDTGCGCRDCCHKVALVIKPPPYPDFHWYRQDRDGHWSHKPGGTQATNVDASGNPITDPRTADRGAYTIFCGCYCVCRGQVTIQ